MNKSKLLALFLCVLLMLMLFGCEKDTLEETPELLPPPSTPKIASVMIKYDGKLVTEGLLTMDISVGTFTLDTDVQKTDERVNADVTFSSKVPAVASITSGGEVTINSVGETVITATAGDKSHQIVLQIVDNSAQMFTITVVGGVASVDGEAPSASATAFPGAIVTLMPTINGNQNFLRWEYKVNGIPIVSDELWHNGDNIFMMPVGNVVITAVFEDIE